MLKFHPPTGWPKRTKGTFGWRNDALLQGTIARRSDDFGAATSVAANGADIALCSIVEKPANFNHQSVTLQGTALGVKETTSHRGNDYTTFKLQDPAAAVPSTSSLGATPHCRTAIKSAWTVYSRPNIIRAPTGGRGN